jgi:oligopeptide transport system substrate-binding protein
MNNTLLNRTLRVALIVAVLLGAMGVVTAQDEVKTLVTGLGMVGGDIPTIDPGVAETSSSIEVINQLFIGLRNQEETDGSQEDGIATMEVSEDGLTHTFTIMPDIYWVRYNADSGEVEQLLDDGGNPRVVTAGDVAYGMLRSLNPETASPYSYVLVPYIEGAEAYNSGEGTAEDVGINVIDDSTLEITAPEAVAFTPAIYGLWMARAVPQWIIEEFGDVWTEPENIATYGPYAVKEWAHEESITIIKNPFWAGTDAIPAAAIDEVTFRFLDPQQQFAEYQAGSMDAASVPLEEIERVQSDATLSAEYKVGNSPCTYYLGYDNTEAPLDNANLRRALSFAIDRESIVTNVTRGGQIPAQWFSRPGLDAAPTLETHPDLGAKFDPELAQEALQMALEDLGLSDVSELPALTLSYNDSSGHAAIVQAIQQMWTDTLGITVQLTPLEPSTYFASVSEDAPMIYRSGWCQDYPDANNFLFDVFYSQSSQNDPGFANEEYDALVEQARVETDVETRRDLYAQAEEILVVEEAGIAPIYWYTANRLIKPYVEYTESVTGNESYYNWDVSR